MSQLLWCELYLVCTLGMLVSIVILDNLVTYGR